jgi:cytochrome c-type biogenesis protein CcmH/NrfG
MIYTSIRAIAKLKEVWYEAKRLGPDGSEVVRLIEEAIEELTEEAVAPYAPSLNPLNEAELRVLLELTWLEEARKEARREWLLAARRRGVSV